MASKIPFILGLGAGYVLGTRAGRAQYERLKSAATRVTESTAVRERVGAAQTRLHDVVRQQGEVVTDKVADAVKERLFGQPTHPAEPVDVGEAQVRTGH